MEKVCAWGGNTKFCHELKSESIIPLPYLLEDLRSATGASTGKSQQRFIRVYPKGTGERACCKQWKYSQKGMGKESLLQATEICVLSKAQDKEII
jgi:hypothetical protein